MFKFLKNIMNNEEVNLTNDAYSLHRILKTDIKKIPNEEEDEISDRSNKTIIMISHQLSVAATCDRVLVMDKGEIVQEGSHKDLVKMNGLYKKLWEREIATKIVESQK